MELRDAPSVKHGEATGLLDWSAGRVQPPINAAGPADTTHSCLLGRLAPDTDGRAAEQEFLSLVPTETWAGADRPSDPVPCDVACHELGGDMRSSRAGPEAQGHRRPDSSHAADHMLKKDLRTELGISGIEG